MLSIAPQRPSCRVGLTDMFLAVAFGAERNVASALRGESGALPTVSKTLGHSTTDMGIAPPPRRWYLGKARQHGYQSRSAER
jgi:hypothetical protein